jgi:hypothetical protein
MVGAIGSAEGTGAAGQPWPELVSRHASVLTTTNSQCEGRQSALLNGDEE